MKAVWTCRTVLVLVAGLALDAGLAAQNETNWHPQSNGFDGIYLGLGLGAGTATNTDGVGKWIPGEDLRGSRRAAFSRDFSFKVTDLLIPHCLLGASGSGQGAWNPVITGWEYDGRNANRPDVFTNPTSTSPGLVMGSATGAPLGDPPGTTASILAVGVPTYLNPVTVFLPNNGLVPTSTGGTVSLVAVFGGPASATLPTGCYNFQVGAVTTIAASTDDIDGWWVWHVDQSTGGSTNYYGFSFNEQDLWQSGTLHGLDGGNGVLGFPATTEWSLHVASLEAGSTAALAPAASAAHGAGTYYGVTINTNSGFGSMPPLSDPNGGYDIGAGSRALSLSGKTGHADANDVLLGAPIAATQDPGGSSGGSPTYVTPSLGVQTWDTRDYNDNGLPDDGGDKVTLISFHWDLFAGVPPDAAGDVLGSPGTRLPIADNSGSIPGGDFPQALTLAWIPTFAHTVIGGSAGFPGPEGKPSAFQGAGPAVGTSSHIPTQSLSGACQGLPLGITYGTVHMLGSLPTYDPQQGSTSGRKVLFLLD